MNKNKKILVSVALATTMLATSISAFAYTDVSADHWAKSYIDNLSGKKYVSGYEDGTYKPDSYVTRAEFAKILTNIFGVIDKSGVSLTDVADSAWYSDTMKIAVKAGYITGYSDGTVRPEANITRQEAAVMVYRAWALSPEGTATFTDSAAIADWASNQVATLASKNVLNGYEDGTFLPNNYVTRAEVAKIISSALALGINTSATTGSTQTGVTSGIVHIGGSGSSSSSSSSGSSSSGSSSSSSSSSGSSSSGSSSSATDALDDVETPEVDEDNLSAGQDDTTVALIADQLIEALDSNDDIDDDTQLNVDLSLSDSDLEDVILVDAGDGTTQTFAQFKSKLKNLTKAEVAAALSNITLIIPDDKDIDSVKITAKVTTADDDTEVASVQKATSVNYVIGALKAYQAGTQQASDMAIIANNLTTGYAANATTVDKWLESNKVKYELYDDIISEVAQAIDVEITSDNVDTYRGYYDVLKRVVLNALNYVIEKDGNLTASQAASYFSSDVTDTINSSIENAEDAQKIIAIATNFGLKLSSSLDDVNEAASTSGVNNTTKQNLILNVYNNLD